MNGGRRRERIALRTLRAHRWFALLTMTRVLGAALAIVLLLAHRVTHADPLLAVITAVWTPLSLWTLRRTEDWEWAPAVWAADGLAALGLVLSGGDWRSPFYVFTLTTLVLPATSLPWRAAFAWGLGSSALYGAVAWLTEKLPADTLSNTIRLETLATHLFVPVIVTTTLAYSSLLLDRLRVARSHSERLALQAERQRIAWELHDSAKQRVHAAHLMLSALDADAGDTHNRALLDGALAELRNATADMETSVAELRTPLDGRPVDELLRERADELSRTGVARIDVRGRLPSLPPLVAAHTYRIAAEALTNAVRHAGCTAIEVTLAASPDMIRLTIADDGVGMPAEPRPGGHGLRSMHGRAETIGADLRIGPGPGGHGTSVALALPTPGGSP
ncbi:MAG TPA: ATP-binding protein [Baekduia sp.]|uniref:sensor histidine kinase n=1 Tax=Baekduia sp. TaxID=2600305 RepID=UPI002D78F35E|nr:ATP-binding protein [Baekduia sp.]HET6506211.1 ATP-binding protein [Baekduia sp.]